MKLHLALIAAVALLDASVSYAQQPAAAPKSAAAAATVMKRRVPDTLMFSIDELNDIQLRAASSGRGSDGKEKKEDAIENATLYLSTIVYYGPNDWTIWVNGVPIGPKQDFQAFKVTSINSGSVELLVPLSAEGMRPVRLAPNQTFVAKSGAVIEGPWK